MDHPETDAPLPASDDQLSPADSSLPHLLYALEIETPTLVPSDSLPVHHEEIVIAAHEPPPGDDDGTQEYPVLSVEVPSSAPGSGSGASITISSWWTGRESEGTKVGVSISNA